ncbi:hypothetical protein HZ992_23290 [Rhizobacter sp. AJA081-3]|jgi:hypothetical protein|uniref:hypothetical protein n=1 Tax=Rhizobacter sp. AJA081-3 TaxID=2753607 RepID=UPI001ADF2130|nr:hypothetical protein [Rhizobacter sp. AJA081-3]QTN23003.1 hypothetical protein HZ992_23290 [Rhizobacter sp. AJA081-3]
MNRQPNRYLASTQRRLSQYGTGIEWEELPSLTERLVNVDTRRGDFQHSSGFSTTWDVTMPAALDPITESGPFQEPLRGLVTRELREPDVFRHFFA